MIATTLILMVACAATAADSRVATDGWALYRSAATGLSFRHPPSLRVHERDPQEFGLQDAELIVDLIRDTKLNPGTVVLRFIVNRGGATPQTVSQRLKSLRMSCRSLSFVFVNGNRTPVCVSCGRAACHWTVDVLQPRECTILTLLAGSDADQAQPPPHDGILPLLSIIETVHFE
ncbi:MAG: hypothetical protein WCB12_09085 [Bryobacteraceae bacterium]